MFESRVALVVTIVLTAHAGVAPAAQEETGGPEVVVADPDRALDLSPDGHPLIEPHLAVAPGDPNHLFGAAAVVETVDWSESFRTSCIGFASFDGGATWNRQDFAVGECGDPWVAITTDGTAIFTALGEWEGERGIVLFRSGDGGRTWAEPPIVFTGGHDHQTMTVDSTAGARAGALYLVSGEVRGRPGGGFDFTAFVARSDDSGASFPNRSSVVPSNLSFETQTPVVLSDGTLAVPFGDHGTKNRRRLERRRNWLLLSRDGGESFSEPKFITEACTRSRPASWPSLAVDRSGGPFADRLYHVCEAQGFAGILLARSADGGETWTEPIRVDSTRPRNPYTKTPVMAVGPGGTLGVLWYDGSGASFHQCHVLRFAASLDGGETFTEEITVSEGESCPYVPANGDAAWRWPAGGDYVGMVAVGPGRFRLLWADARDGPYGLRTAEVLVEG